MRFLADENFKRRAAVLLQAAGHDVMPVPKGLDDKAVAELARVESRVLLTHDNDFSDPLKFPPARFPGIVLLKLQPPTLERIARALEHLLLKVGPQEFAGTLVVVSDVDVFEISTPRP